MDMECLNCGKEVEQKTGKRAKKFCDDNCRVTYWQKNNNKKAETKCISIAEYEEFQRINSIVKFIPDENGLYTLADGTKGRFIWMGITPFPDAIYKETLPPKEMSSFEKAIAEAVVDMNIKRPEPVHYTSIENIKKLEEGLAEKLQIPPMPVKMAGENPIDFAARKNEWKIKYNQ